MNYAQTHFNILNIDVQHRKKNVVFLVVDMPYKTQRVFILHLKFEL